MTYPTATVQSNNTGLFYTDRKAFNTQLVGAMYALPYEYSLVALRVEKGAPTKAPIGSAWQKIESKREDIENKIREGYASGIGIKLGEPSGGIVALDVDGLTARKALEGFLKGQSLPKTVTFSSGKPGRSQYLFMVPPDKREGLSTKNFKYKNSEDQDEELNFRWTGTQSALPPSAHPQTPHYSWVDGCSPGDVEVAELPGVLFDLWWSMIEPTKVTTPSGVAYSKDKNTDSTLKTEVPDGGIPPILGTYTIPIEKLLANSNKKRGRGVAEGGRDNAAIAYARDILGVQHKEFLLVPFNGGYYRLDITQNAAGLFETFCDGCNPPLGDSDRVRIWKSANSKESTPSIRSEGTLIDLGILHLKQILGGDKPSSDGGRHNILTLDNSIRSMGETVRLNQMTGKVEVGNEPLDLNQLRRFTMNKFGYTLSTEDCQQCWVGIAQENSYHPVEVYLASLPTNTPTLDLSTLASKLLGNDSKGASAMLKRKLIAAVARVMEPGCKDDSLLVLMGAQGCGKTSFIETLASTEWFSNDLSDITNKDHLRLLTENWLIELGEVDDVMNRKTNEAMKHFLSHKKDTYRPAYGRENITAPRSSSLFASTNKTELLNDSTGTRRFWVVEVKQRIDLTQVCAMRDSIWYSALQSYKNGEQWYLTDEEDKEREEEAKQFTEVDPWVESLYLPKLVQRKGVGYTTSYSALYDHLDIPMAARTKATDRRLHSILTGLGFIRKAVKVGGKSVTCWYTAIKTW